MKNLIQRLCFTATLLLSLNAFCQIPKLNSLPSVQPTVFLDFDGQTVQSAGWQSGARFVCAPSGLSTAKITEIFNRVSEDYRPFAVNITTDSAKFLASLPAQRIRIIITPTSAWYAGVGGITYTNSFTWGDNTPGFVFSDRLSDSSKFIGEACSHESGHALGLSHQAKYDANCTLLENYSTGYGSGETGWAPVMGSSAGKNMTGWNNGPLPYGCTMFQDNLSIITSQNGFTYRPDDFNETLDNTTKFLNASSFNIQGIISTSTDKDAYALTLPQSGAIHIEAIPYSLGGADNGANLDILMTLYNSSKTLIRTYDPLSAMNILVDTTLAAGTYYIVINGTGNNNTGNYGSLGSYTLKGSLVGGVLPVHNITLQGSIDKKMHKLSWNIISDETITRQVLESSSDGINYNPVMTDITGAMRYFNYTPAVSGTIYYRLQATSVTGQSMYSNIIVLKANGNSNKFSVLVQQTITVTAPDNYFYNLYDANGRLMASGREKRGSNTIRSENLPKGMYILQIIGDNYKQTERIIKQ